MFFFKQKTAYYILISDWSSDVCSSDLPLGALEYLHSFNVKHGTLGHDAKGKGGLVHISSDGWRNANCLLEETDASALKYWRTLGARPKNETRIERFKITALTNSKRLQFLAVSNRKGLRNLAPALPLLTLRNNAIGTSSGLER